MLQVVESREKSQEADKENKVSRPSRAKSLGTAVRVAVLNLVDLAGSERVSYTSKYLGDRFHCFRS